MGKPSVLLVTNLFPSSAEPTRGIFTKQLMTHLREWYDIDVVTPYPWFPAWLKKFKSGVDVPFQEKIDTFDVYHPRYLVTPKIGRSLYGFFFFLGCFSTLRRLIKKKKYNLINVQWVYPDGFGVVLASKLLRIPVIVHGLGCDINEYSKYFWRRQWIKFTLRNSTANIMVSEGLKTRSMELGVEERSLHVIHNGIDQTKFKPGNRQKARESLGLPLDKKIILYVGNFNVEKGLPDLLEAFQPIARSRDNVVLCAVGSGPLEAEIQQQIDNLGIRNQVLLCGRKGHDEIPQYIIAADMLCLPSLREGCPNIVLESLASGTPVIASQVGAVPEMLKASHVRLGIMAPPQNPELLSKALDEALDYDWQVAGNFKWMSWRDDAKATAELFQEISQ